MIASPTTENLQQIFSLKRDLVAMRRVITPMRDMFPRNADRIAELPGLETDDRLYFRDLYDSLIRVSELVDSYRDLLSRRDRHVPLDGRQPAGRGQQQLTIIATIFLPLTLPDRLLRPELRVSDQPHHRRDVDVLGVRDRAAGRLGDRLLDLLPPQGLDRDVGVRSGASGGLARALPLPGHPPLRRSRSPCGHGRPMISPSCSPPPGDPLVHRYRYTLPADDGRGPRLAGRRGA